MARLNSAKWRQEGPRYQTPQAAFAELAKWRRAGYQATIRKEHNVYAVYTKRD